MSFRGWAWACLVVAGACTSTRTEPWHATCASWGEMGGELYCDVGLMYLALQPWRFRDADGAAVVVSGYYDMCEMPDAVALRPDSVYGLGLAHGESIAVVDGWERVEYAGPGYYQFFGRIALVRPEGPGAAWRNTFVGIAVETAEFRGTSVWGRARQGGGTAAKECMALWGLDRAPRAASSDP